MSGLAELGVIHHAAGHNASWNKGRDNHWRKWKASTPTWFVKRPTTVRYYGWAIYFGELDGGVARPKKDGSWHDGGTVRQIFGER